MEAGVAVAVEAGVEVEVEGAAVEMVAAVRLQSPARL